MAMIQFKPTIRASALVLAGFGCALGAARAPAAAAELATGAVAPQAAAPMVSSVGADYRVGSGDLLNITVYRSPDLTSLLRVGTDGTIMFPGVGQIGVDGFTAAEVATAVAQQLRARGILISPQVNVLVSDVRAHLVNVLGDVGRPGQVPLDQAHMTLSNVLARAGTAFGNGNAIVHVKNGKTGKAEAFTIDELLTGEKDRLAEPGDLIVVQAPANIYVTGEVGRSGGFPLQRNMTVGQALALGGGITPRGAYSRLTLTRTAPDGTKHTYKHVDMNMELQANDLIVAHQRLF